jgi:hypothetical protein
MNISEGDNLDVTLIGGNKLLISAHLPHHSQWKFPNPKLNKEDKEWLSADKDKIPDW